MKDLWDDPLATNKPSSQSPAESDASPTLTEPEAAAINQTEPSRNLPSASSSIEPVKAEDKRVINGLTDVNQLAPFKYPWAWNFFLNANKNHWTPLDINMSQDVIDYNKNLTDEEKQVYQNVMSYLTTSGITAMRNIGLAVMEKMTAPELQIYQARQIYEEALHTSAYQHCIETIGLDQGEIYNRYRIIPEIDQKIQAANRRLNTVMRPDIDLNDKAELENFTLAYLFFSAVFEGCWLYNGFSPIFALQRRGLMAGTAKQLQFIMRDKAMHCSFGIRAVKQIIKENKVKLDPTQVRQMWDEAEAAESVYAHFILKHPIDGYAVDDHMEQFRFTANKRATELGMQAPFAGAECTLPWLADQANPNNDKDPHYDTSSSDESGGSLSWD